MQTVTRFVGLDYHQDSVQVCVLDQHGNRLPIAVNVGQAVPDEPSGSSVRVARVQTVRRLDQDLATYSIT